MTYTFDSVILPSGTLNLDFITNDGGGSQTNIIGEHFISISTIREAIEESGMGGIPKLSDVDFELYDLSGVFQNTIFSSSITKIHVNITITISGTEYSVMYGQVDTSTIKYRSIYDNESGNEKHIVSFTVFSIIKELETITTSYYLGVLDTIAVPDNYDPIQFYYVRVVDCINYAISLLTNINTSVTYNVTSSVYNTVMPAADPFTYLTFKIRNAAGTYQELFASSGDLMTQRDVYSILQKIMMSFDLVMKATFDLSGNTLNLTITERGLGSSLTPATLLSSDKTVFYGYDAIKVYDSVISPDSLTNEQFALVPNRYSFDNKVSISLLTSNGGNLSVIDSINGAVVSILDDSQTYFDYNNWLLTRFVDHWSDRDAYERKYSGVGIGVNPITLSDYITIGGQNYTVYEIERDLMQNTVTAKCVQY